MASRLAVAAGIVALVISCRLPTMQINPMAKSPLAVTLSGALPSLLVGQSMTVTPNVAGYPGGFIYVFTLNGKQVATTRSSNPAWVIGSNLPAGTYNLQVTALTADGGRGGTTTLTFAIVPGTVSVNLSWNPSSSTAVAGYKVFYGQTSGAYTSMVDAGNSTTVAVPGLIPGRTYYFVTTAYTGPGLQSPYSNEISYTVPLT